MYTASMCCRRCTKNLQTPSLLTFDGPDGPCSQASQMPAACMLELDRLLMHVCTHAGVMVPVHNACICGFLPCAFPTSSLSWSSKGCGSRLGSSEVPYESSPHSHHGRGKKENTTSPVGPSGHPVEIQLWSSPPCRTTTATSF